jgi:hypothetical protein
MSSHEISLESILPTVFVVRGVKAMLDSDLAALYEVETKVLNQAVKRNIDRFPKDFMFTLSKEEFKILKSQNVTSSWGGRRTLPYAFTEQGIAMLSSVLKSKKAIEVNISIMRAFVKMRQLITETGDLRLSIESLRNEYDEKFEIVFQTLNSMISVDSKNKPIGFIWPDKDRD